MMGPIKMYTIRPIVSSQEMSVRLPNCMYRLKNIHDDAGENGTANETQSRRVESVIVEQVKRFLKNNPTTETAMTEVLLRQEVVLKQLEDLQKQIATIRSKLQCEKVVESQSNLANLPSDFTLNANPNNPPYSLILLRNHWRTMCNVKVFTYAHSTIAKLSEAAQTFVDMLQSSETETIDSLPVLTVRLIWREVGVNQLELSGNRAIQDEVNFLRYLARLTNALKYDESNIEIDTLLDACYALTRSTTKIAKQALLQRLGKKLGKNPFILGEFSLLDIAAYSAIKQNVPDGVNVTLTKWMKNCEDL